MFVIEKIFQINKIISIAAGEKIVSWCKSTQILVDLLYENVCDCRIDRYLRNHFAGIFLFVVLCAEITLAKRPDSYQTYFGRKRGIVMIKFGVLESNTSLYLDVCTVRDMLSKPDFNIIRDIRKASELFRGRAAEERGVKLDDISKFTGYNQDVVAWAIGRFIELAVMG